MPLPFKIQGDTGTNVLVTKQGELRVQGQNFADIFTATLALDDIAVNLVTPKSLEKFIVTGLIINTNRDVGVNGASIDVYQTSSETSSTIDKLILNIDQVKSTTSSFLPLFAETIQGKYINAISNDSVVNITMFGYFISV